MNRQKVVSSDRIEAYLFWRRVRLVGLLLICICVVFSLFIVAIPIEQKKLTGTVIVRPVSTPWSVLKILPSPRSGGSKEHRINYVCGVELAGGERVLAYCPADQPFGFDTAPVRIIYLRRISLALSTYHVI